MLDMGFLPDIRRILRALPADRQTLDVLGDHGRPRSASSPTTSCATRWPILIGGPQQPASGIVHSVYPVAQDRKAALLTTLLQRERDGARCSVFVKRKVDADQLARAITRSGVPATSIHSDRRQEDRIAALEAFRRGEYPVHGRDRRRGARHRRRGHLARRQLRRAVLLRRLHPPRRPDGARRRRRRGVDLRRRRRRRTACAPSRRRSARRCRASILPNFDHGAHEHASAASGQRGRRAAVRRAAAARHGAQAAAGARGRRGPPRRGRRLS